MNMVGWKHRSFFSLDWITGLISRRPSSWNRVQHHGRIERGDPAPALAALRATLERWEDCAGLPMVHDERGRAVPPLNSAVMLDPILAA